MDAYYIGDGLWRTGFTTGAGREDRGNEEVEVENFTLGTAYEGGMTFILSNSEGDTVKLPLVFLTESFNPKDLKSNKLYLSLLTFKLPKRYLK